MKITITIDVPKLKTTKAAQEFALNVCEHLTETLNDDNSLKCFWTHVPKIRKDTKS